MAPFTCLIERAAPAILVVDDIRANVDLLEAIFIKEGFAVHSALGASEAMKVIEKHHVDLAVVDIMMPGIDGFRLCSTLKQKAGNHFFPVILLTALSDRNSRIKGLEVGADDFISKPFETLELVLKIRSLLKLKNLHEELDHSENIILTLAVAMEARDPYTKGHSTRVSKLSMEFSSFLGLSGLEREEMKKAGILHDIGKICLSQSILRKPGPLTEQEQGMIQTHVLLGEDLCRPLVSMRRILPAIRHHHERWDGKGFPDRLSGQDIPIMARILTIVDSFDAMVSVRPYRERRSVRSALTMMKQEQNSGQWDSELLGYFLSMMSPEGDKGYRADA
jgi:putative two-component system response regulator